MLEPVYTPLHGLLLLGGYAACAFALTWLFVRRDEASKTVFLLANRNVGPWPSAFSIAATWIWAPALFISSREAYARGVAGLFWFTVPNILCLILFAFFAERIRRRLPEGFTLSAFIRERFSRRVQALYWVELTGLAACSCAVQLLAGGKALSMLTGLPFFWITLALALTALAYSAFSGLRASVITDVAQMALILLVGCTLVPWAVWRAGGLETLAAGLGGRSGEFTSLWAGKGAHTAWVFGVPVTIGLMAGPFGDQSFWQRAFATRAGQVKKAFIYGALIFAAAPLTLSLLGFAAAGMKLDVADPELVGLEVVLRLLPTWCALPFTLMLISGLASTLDSNLCAMASLAGHDFFGPGDTAATTQTSLVRAARWSMVGLTLAALFLANVPGMQILYLFLFYGTLRASTFLPTILAVGTSRVGERGMFWGILIAIGAGLPLFAFGKFQGHANLAVLGSLLTILVSGTLAFLGSKPGGDSASR